MSVFRRLIRKMHGVAKDITPRQEFDPVVRSLSADLGPTIVEQFFANSGYAAPLSMLVRLKALVRELQPELVVEFGSGVSTVVITEVLSEIGGFLVTIDESPKWLSDTFERIERQAPVAFLGLPHPSGLNHEALIKIVSFSRKPGLVVIDGPSKGGRFTDVAFEVYLSLLTPTSACVVDDTDREENDLGAYKLAEVLSLCKFDYRDDPIHTRHCYSILLPKQFNEKLLSL